MTVYAIKTILAIVLLGFAGLSFFSMMARFGRPGDEARSERLRRLHKTSGYIFIGLLAPMVVLGGKFLVEMGDGLSPRGTFHFVLAATLLTVLLLKYMTVKTHRQLLRYAASLGMTLFSLTLVIFLITAAHWLLLTAAGGAK